MKRAIVVGSGAGGAAAALGLLGAFDVTVIEAGREFRPFSLGMPVRCKTYCNAANAPKKSEAPSRNRAPRSHVQG